MNDEKFQVGKRQLKLRKASLWGSTMATCNFFTFTGHNLCNFLNPGASLFCLNDCLVTKQSFCIICSKLLFWCESYHF